MLASAGAWQPHRMHTAKHGVSHRRKNAGQRTSDENLPQLSQQFADDIQKHAGRIEGVGCAGKWQNFWAVLRAQKDFFVMRKHFSKDRQKNLQSTVNQNIGGVLHGSILWQYYVCRRTVARKLQGL